MSARSNSRALRELQRQERAREAMKRQVTKAFDVPYWVTGARAPWYRRVWQARTRRP